MKSLHIEGQILQQREPNKWQMDSIDGVHVQNVHNSAQIALGVNTNMIQSDILDVWETFIQLPDKKRSDNDPDESYCSR